MLCWFFEHKWSPGFDPHFEQCLRCSRVRPKQFKGCVPCAYCARPVTKPIKTQAYVDIWVAILPCPHCGKKNKWEREYANDDWGSPALIVDFKMD